MHTSPFYLHPQDLPDHDLALLYQAESPYLREIVLNDPRTPAHVIAAWYPQATLEHLYVMAGHLNTPTSILVNLLQHPHIQIRSQVAIHPGLPIDQLEQLSTHPDVYLRVGCARNPSLPSHLAIRLAHDTDQQVLSSIARHPALPIETIHELAKLPECLLGIVQNPSTPADLLHTLSTTVLSQRKSDIQLALLRHPHLKPETISAIFQCFIEQRQDPHSFSLIVNHPNCPPLLLHQIATTIKHPGTLVAVAKSSRTPPDTLAYLARTSQSNKVRQALLSNSNTPTATRLTLGLRET